MCCSVLQHVAACCSVLQYVAVCCSVLQCVAVCCRTTPEVSTLQVASIAVVQCVTVCCSVLQCVAVCCSVLRFVAGLLLRCLLSLCVASRMWVRPWSVVIVPPERNWEFRWDTEMCWCFIYVTIKPVAGTTERTVIESQTFPPPHQKQVDVKTFFL